MTSYEIMLIFRPDLGEKNIEKEIAEIKKHITGDGGEITSEEVWGPRELAYRIKRENTGFYIVLNFILDPEKCHEIGTGLNINQAVLRYLITKTPKNYSLRAAKELSAEAEKVVRDDASGRKGGPRKPEFEPKKEEHKEPKREEVKEVKKEAPKKEAPKKVTRVKKVEKEEASEEVVKEKPKKEEKVTLEDVDAKLKSIIDDPDISL